MVLHKFTARDAEIENTFVKIAMIVWNEVFVRNESLIMF